MLKQTLSIVRHNLAFYAMFVICSVGVSIFDEYSKKSAAAGATFFLSALLSMNVQNSVLRDLNFTAASKARKLPLGGYMFRSFALTLLAFLLMLPAILFLLRPDGVGKTYFMLWAMLAFLAAFTIVLSLLGTWLPANIHGANATISDALRRGLARFLSTASLVFLGLAVPLVAAFIALLLAVSFSSADLIVDGHLNITAIAISLVSNVLQAIGWTYISVVLVRRYMEAEHIEPSSGADLLTVFP